MAVKKLLIDVSTTGLMLIEATHERELNNGLHEFKVVTPAGMARQIGRMLTSKEPDVQITNYESSKFRFRADRETFKELLYKEAA